MCFQPFQKMLVTLDVVSTEKTLAETSAADVLKTLSKRAIEKAQEATTDFIRNKIARKIT